MNNQRLEELLVTFEENQLSAGELAELKQILAVEQQARARLVESGVIGSIARARVQAWKQSGSSAPAEIRANVPTVARPQWIRLVPYVAACAALVALLAFAFRPAPAYITATLPPAEPRYVAELLSADGAAWSGGKAPVEVGENLKSSSLGLTSGRIELRFLNGARVAIQGPATFRLDSESRMNLSSGRLSADVPPSAVGFTVETPVTSVRDLGTRFGVAVDKGGATETHVFDGEVDVTPVSNAEKKAAVKIRAPHGLAMHLDKAPVALRSNPAEFPLPQRVLDFVLPCADFELGATGWGVSDALPPSESNVWGGDHIIRCGAERGVSPKSGSGMLRFMGGMRPGQPAKSAGGASELFCWIDLRQFHSQFQGRRVTADFSVWFNRIQSERSSFCVPTVIAATYGPGTKPGLDAWRARLLGNNPGHALSNCDAEIRSDDDLKTWEQATARVTIAPHAEVLLLSVRVRSDDPDQDLRSFDDVYADAPALVFRLGDATVPDEKNRSDKTGAQR